MKERKKQTLFCLLLLFFSGIGGILYLIIVPPWQSPDEPTHFEYAQVLANKKSFLSLPQSDLKLQREIIASMDKYSFWSFLGQERPQPLPNTFIQTPFLKLVPTQIGIKPPLYYFIASLFLRLFPQYSIIFKLYLLRSLSLFFSITTVAVIFFTARLILPQDYYFQLTVAACAAFLPQFMLIGTSVSPDPIANMISASFIYCLIKIQVRGLTIFRFMVSLALVIIGVSVTYKCFELVPIFFLGIIIYVIFEPLSLKKWGRWLAGMTLMVGLFTVAFVALARIIPSVTRILIVRLRQPYTNLSGLLRGELHPASFYYPWFNNELFKSFWIKFGWAMFTLKPVYYFIIKIACILAVIGLMVFLIRLVLRRKSFSPALKRAFFTLIVANLVVLTAYYLYWGLGYRNVTAQGRHLFISLSAWAILFVLGWKELLSERMRVFVYPFLVMGFILLDGISLFGYILPTFDIQVWFPGHLLTP